MCLTRVSTFENIRSTSGIKIQPINQVLFHIEAMNYIGTLNQSILDFLMCTCIYTYIYIFAYVYIYICTQLQHILCVYTTIHVYMHLHLCIYIYIYTYIYTHMSIYISVMMSVCPILAIAQCIDRQRVLPAWDIFGLLLSQTPRLQGNASRW